MAIYNSTELLYNDSITNKYNGGIMNQWFAILQLEADDIKKLVAMYTPIDYDLFVLLLDTRSTSLDTYYQLRNILARTWSNAPDTREIYKMHGFLVLCDLLDDTIKPPIYEEDL
jgi:hypothetical protein